MHYHNGCMWTKRNNSEFNISMGTYDSIESCEKVGIFLMSLLRYLFDINNTGLYRDGGMLLVRKNKSKNHR